MVSRKEWYERANAIWPAEIPPLTETEAVKAARKLYRFVKRSKCPYKIAVTTGNRANWVRGNVLYVNPTSTRHGSGWESLLHDLSHWLDPGRAHSKEHAQLEMRLVKEVVRRGWLNGSLKDKPKVEQPAVDPKAAKYRCLVIRMDRWIAKKKRAERALAKLNRQRKYYERVGRSA